MQNNIKAKSALISVFNKQGLIPVVTKMHELGIDMYSTGGTASFVEALGIPVIKVEDLTSYPSILGGRVKTLHPKIFGGILNRRMNKSDQLEINRYDIPQIDIVIVDLYPFEDTVKAEAAEADIIEKIDIGGISLIRAAAKNYKDVICVSSVDDYDAFLNLLEEKNGESSIKERKYFSSNAFRISSHYDAEIFNYFSSEKELLKLNHNKKMYLGMEKTPTRKVLFLENLTKYFLNIMERNFHIIIYLMLMQPSNLFLSSKMKIQHL
jgi:phosphoribosylaminoimidazolecarboxamide formyltransferase/IMP cyclohydrolase